jgi:tryptophan-rich sensory protein
MKRRSSSWLALLGFGGACAAAALLGVRANRRGKRWYDGLSKPPFNPPDAVFAPVWTGLYALMTASAHRVWQAPPSPSRTRALALWGTQLGANAAWSPLFFGARRPRAALADLGLLVAAIALYAREAGKVDRAAAWMMAPYGAWCAFAGLLNEELVRRN